MSHYVNRNLRALTSRLETEMSRPRPHPCIFATLVTVQLKKVTKKIKTSKLKSTGLHICSEIIKLHNNQLQQKIKS